MKVVIGQLNGEKMSEILNKSRKLATMIYGNFINLATKTNKEGLTIFLNKDVEEIRQDLVMEDILIKLDEAQRLSGGEKIELFIQTNESEDFKRRLDVKLFGGKR